MLDMWPEGRRAALSVTFDDARSSQVDVALPVLDRHGIKATFYVLVEPVRKRVSAWREVVAAGHEIGNHSLTHPCSGNFSFSRRNALEDYTPQRIEDDILAANDALEEVLRVRPVTFAYPCGQHMVGRGTQARSYVPVVARHFLVGRGWRDETPNHPLCCDLAHVAGRQMDAADADALRALADEALAVGGWLVLAGHDVGTEGSQRVRVSALATLCAYAAERADVLWTDTVAAVGAHLACRRGQAPPGGSLRRS